MNKLNRLLVVVFAVGLLALQTQISKTHEVVLGESGYVPQKINIKKSDTIVFATTLNKPFWPASNPHPNHTQFKDFDPKKGTKPGEVWTFRFETPGVFTYHDHLNPSYTGSVSVSETNLFKKALSSLQGWWRMNFVSHDDKYVNSLSTKCVGMEWENRQVFIDCWNKYFADFQKDFGPQKTLSILDKLTKKGTISLSDCHNFADQIGSDAYWQEVSGGKFKINQDYGLCSNGFMHGYMLEHVSHGQDFEASFRLCESLNVFGESLSRECFAGAGSGLAYYYWNFLGNDIAKIVENSKVKCRNAGSNVDSCIYGVYGGMEHLYLKIHGSDINIDTKTPFAVCAKESVERYTPYCYEKTVRPLFAELDFDIRKTIDWILTIPYPVIRKNEAKNIGNFVSQFWIYNSEKDLYRAIDSCSLFPDGLYMYCVEGVYEGVFSNLDAAGKFLGFNCNLNGLGNKEKEMCVKKMTEVLEAEKIF